MNLNKIVEFLKDEGVNGCPISFKGEIAGSVRVIEINVGSISVEAHIEGSLVEILTRWHKSFIEIAQNKEGEDVEEFILLQIKKAILEHGLSW